MRLLAALLVEEEVSRKDKIEENSLIEKGKEKVHAHVHVHECITNYYYYLFIYFIT